MPLAACILALVVADRRFGPPSRAALSWLSVLWLLLVVGRYAEVTGGEGRYMIRLKSGGTPDKPGAKPEEALPLLRDVLETRRIELDNGAPADELFDYVKQERPDFERDLLHGPSIFREELA